MGGRTEGVVAVPDEKKPPAIRPFPNSFVIASSLLSSPSDDKETLGDIPPVPTASVPPASVPPASVPHVENLGLAMKREMVDRAPGSSNPRNSAVALTLSSDDDDEFDLSPEQVAECECKHLNVTCMHHHH